MGQWTRLGIAAAFGMCVASAPLHAAPITSLVVFGDSNVDIGRLATELAGDVNDGAIPPPNTVGGRSSDGEILPEFVAERVGVSQLNFGWGGAMAGETNIVGPLQGAADVTFTGTLRQIDEYEALSGGFADPDALYLVFAGSNDLALVDKNDFDAVDTAIAGADQDLRTAVSRLSALGAQDIVVATRTPRPVLSDETDVEDEADEAARNDASGRQLSAVIRGLVADLDATLASNVMLFDAEMLIRDIIANSGSNGFQAYSSDPSQFCSEGADCATVINFDSAHKTSAVHSVLADAFIEQFDLTASEPAPVPLPASGLLLAAGIAALGARRAVRRAA